MPDRSVPSRSALSASQRDAVVSEASSLHISGRFGTGKTTALAHRAVAQSTRVSTEAMDTTGSVVRVVTASGERRRRLSQLVAQIANSGGARSSVDVVTAPQWAARILRREDPRMTRSILRPVQAQDLVGEVLSSLGFKDLSQAPFEVWRELHIRAMRDDTESRSGSDSSAIPPSFPLDDADFRAVQAAYNQRLRRARALDISRLLKAALDVSPPEPLASILIDDLHHLTPLERRFIHRVDTAAATVSEEDVSERKRSSEGEAFIFRDAASVSHIRLTDSFVPDSIAKAVSAVAETEFVGYSAPSEAVQVTTAPSGSQEAEQIARHVRQKVDDGAWDTGEIIVCAGAARIRATVESALREEGLRVRVPGRPFHNQTGPCDLLAYLHVLANPHDDVHLAHILNRPSRGIGRKTQARIKAYAADHNLSVWDAISHADDNSALTSRARRVLRAFRELMNPLVETLHDSTTHPDEVQDIARDLVRKTEYLTNVTRGQTREQIEKEGQIERLLRQLPSSGSTRDATEEPTAKSALQRVLDRVALGLMDAADVDVRINDAVTLTSIRDVRGVHSGIVIVVGLEEGVCPGGWAVRRKELLEDERQALARAMASARGTLLLTWAQSRGTGREEEPTTRSRFLDTLHQDGEPFSWVASVPLRSGEDASGYRASLRAKQAGSTAAAPPTDAEIDEIVAGQRVRHPKLGDGTVESVTTDNGRRIAEVHFDERGTKTLQLKYAPLDVLG